MRTLVGIVSVFCLCYGLASAEEFGFLIKKVDGNKITGVKLAGKKDGDKAKPADVTLNAAANVKVTKGGKFNKETKKLEGGDAVDGGLTNAMFTKGNVMSRVVTEGDNVTEIRVMGGGQFKADPNKFGATIKKIDGNKITVVKGFGFGKPKVDAPKGKEVILTVADNCKFVSIKYNKETKKVETTDLTGGLKNEALTKENVRVRITVDNNNNVTEISIGGGRRGPGGPGFPGGGKKKEEKSV